MPVDPEVAIRLGVALFRSASDVELSLTKRISAALARGIDAPGWAERQLSEVARLRSGWERDIAGWIVDARRQGASAVTGAWAHGENAALTELRGLLHARAAASPLPGARAALQLAEELSGVIESTKMTTLRSTEDVFRQVVAQTAGRVLLGSDTRLTVAQQVLNRLTARGISGFTDVRGRRWELASYVEMATRTAAQRAATTAHTQTLAGRGVELVIVSNAPQECKLCRPWEGRVLSLQGAGRRRLTVPDLLNPGKLVEVEVTGGVDEARRAGLFHPNCRHSTSAYLPGMTKRPAGPTADPQGDADRQRLRALERSLRAEKLRQAAALDEAARRAASGRIRAVQAAIREHVDTTTAKRQPQRERIGTAR